MAAVTENAGALEVSTDTAALAAKKKGSALIRYDECHRYDRHRLPVGTQWMSDRVRATAQRLRLPIQSLELAALCCGTGQNEEAILSNLNLQGENIAKITCIDGSEGMLDCVRDKLAIYPSAVDALQADVLRDELPFGKQHLVQCIQAVQHFEDSRECRKFASLSRFYSRVRDSLVRRGEFFQIISLPEQVRRSFWFYNLMSGVSGVSRKEDPAHHFADEHPTLERIFSALEANRFRVGSWKIIKRPHFARDSYFGDPSIVLDEDFRHCSSIFWIMKRRGLLQKYDEVARTRIEDGSLLTHRNEVEDTRTDIGISIAISAQAR